MKTINSIAILKLCGNVNIQLYRWKIGSLVGKLGCRLVSFKLDSVSF